MSTADIAPPKQGIDSIPNEWRHFFPTDTEIEEIVRPKVTLVETDVMPMDGEWHRLRTPD